MSAIVAVLAIVSGITATILAARDAAAANRARRERATNERTSP